MTKRLDDGGRSRVVSTARTIFMKKGFHQTTMAELSKRANVSVGQIYRLFRNKGEMIAAIIQEDVDARIMLLTNIRDNVAAGIISPHEGFRRATLEAIENGQLALTFEILAEGLRTPFVGDVIGTLCERFRAILGEILYAACSNLSASSLLAAEEMVIGILFGLGNRSLSRPSLGAQETAQFAADMITGIRHAQAMDTQSSCRGGLPGRNTR